MMPYTGIHDLIVHNFQQERAPGGERKQVCESAAGIVLERNGAGFAASGVFVSETVRLKFPANEMIMTWNGTAPESAPLGIEFRVRGAGADWSGWYQMGAWRPEKLKKICRHDPVYGPLNVDHLKATRMFDEAQYRAKFRSDSGTQTPSLRRISLCVSDTHRAGDAGNEPYCGGAVDLQVPWISQYDPEKVKDADMIQRGVCAATSVTMVLNYYGIPVEVAEIGRRAYDPNARIFGNWAFLVAAASEFGPDAWAQRFNDLNVVESLIGEGMPLILSVSYKKGDLSPKPDRESAGHLIVARGMTVDGDFICNDPDVRDPAEFGRPMIYRRGELGRAFFGHGGVGLVIRK
ncbi:MAG: C39 family peptidase [bacterium]